MKREILILTALIGLSACDQLQAPGGPPAALPPTTAPVMTPPLTAAGDETTVPPSTSDLQQAASVTEVVVLKGQGDTTVKLFGVAGGDPAMNGLQTYIAFFISPAEGWRVFQVGDFLEFKVLNASRGRVDLEVRESDHDQQAGTIGQKTRRMIVGFTLGDDGAPPAAITVTPAR